MKKIIKKKKKLSKERQALLNLAFFIDVLFSTTKYHTTPSVVEQTKMILKIKKLYNAKTHKEVL